MFLLVKRICVISILCGAVMALVPEGGVKRVTNIVCTLCLITMLVGALSGFDFDLYSLELATYNEREREILEGAKEFENKLSRFVIEEQYQTYILDKATELGLNVQDIKLQLRWDSSGVWVPEGIEINHSYSKELSEFIETQFGVAKQRQQWIEND